MTLSKRLCGSILVAGLALSGVVHAGPYSDMYVFGDSLSDVGNDLSVSGGAGTAGNFPATAYYTDGSNTGRFTNGLNYADYLAQDLGLTLTASTLGGTDYAYGGARGSYVRPDVAAAYPAVLSFNSQVAQYESTITMADSNALYVLWIGANDMSDAVTQAFGALMSGGTMADAYSIIGAQIHQTVTDVLTAMGSLEARGATHFLIGNSPNLGLTPSVLDTAAYLNAVYGIPSSLLPALSTGASASFNNALNAYLPSVTAPGVDTHIIDAFGIQTAITNDPTAFGLSNVNNACLNGANLDGSPTGSAPITLCSTPNEYAYFDGEHPSSAMHQIVASAVYAELVPAATVSEPQELALILGSLGLMGFMRRRHTV